MGGQLWFKRQETSSDQNGGQTGDADTSVTILFQPGKAATRGTASRGGVTRSTSLTF
jgi:hypothetical protein